MSNSVQSILFTTDFASMYSIPPLRTLKGHNASKWDVENPIWRGRVKVIELEDENQSLRCEVRLEDATSGELFAIVPYSKDGKGIDPVLDSARYFAITLVDGGRKAVMGLGFPDRSIAFEFNVALQDFKKHSEPAVKSNHTLKDYTLKTGENITVNVGKDRQETNTEQFTAIPKLEPPPSASSIREQKAMNESPFDDDFGDFQG